MARKRFDDEDDRRPPPSARIRVKDTKAKNSDDPPPVKVRADEEDDPEYDRPQLSIGDGAEFDARGRRVNRKRQRTIRMIVNITLGLVFLGVFVGGICLLFWSMRNPPPDPEMIAFVPPDTRFLCGIRVEEARYHETFREKLDNGLKRIYPPEFKYVLDELKLGPSDVNRVMFATNAPSLSLDGLRGVGGDLTVIFKMNPDSEFSNRKKLAQLMNAEEVNYGSKKYYRVGSPSFCYYLPTPRLVVVCNSEAVLTKMLAKDDYEIVLQGNIRDLADVAGGDHYWYVSSGMSGSAFSMGFDPTEANAIAEWGGIHDKKVHFNRAIIFPNESTPKRQYEDYLKMTEKVRQSEDSDHAKVAAGALLSEFGFSVDNNTREAFQQLVSSANVSLSGRMVSSSSRVSTSLVLDIMKDGIKMSLGQGSYTYPVQFPFQIYPPFSFFSSGRAFFPPGMGGSGAPMYGPPTGGIPVGIRP